MNGFVMADQDNEELMFEKEDDLSSNGDQQMGQGVKGGTPVKVFYDKPEESPTSFQA